MSLRPPSSPSPSPGLENGKSTSRQSLGPSARGTPTLVPGSPRVGARPTSELLGPSSGMFQTPEAEALDQWFENLQSYEATLEEMAAASLDVNFKEELSAIEQWFKVLSEAERTAALYSLLQHSTQVQIRFFITVLQQMARSDPMTALLSPAMGGSMQSQMDAKLAQLKSPGLKSGLPASPTTRSFGGAGNRQSLILDNSSNFLSPDSAALASAAKEDAAATLAQQRAKFKASNAAHRISAPVLSSGADGRSAWGASPTLSQVAEQNGPIQEVTIGGSGTTSRPKSTEFTGSPRLPPAEQTITTENSWASMVNTPLIPMFQQKERVSHLDTAAGKLNDWSSKQQQPTAGPPGVPRMSDPPVHRKKAAGPQDSGNHYDDNGNPGQRFRNNNSNNQGGAWGSTRSQGLSNNNSRFGGGTSEDGPGPANLNGLANMQMGGFNMGALGGPGAMGMMPGLAGMPPVSPFALNMLGAMGVSPEAQAQLLAAQMAASGFGQQGWMGMQGPGSAGLNGGRSLRSGPPSGRSGGLKSAGTASSHGLGSSGGTPKETDDVDPALLADIPAWLRSLRLHKYTPNFEGMKWQDMVILDEAALEAKGVAALGARRKMLKTFELVRKKMGIEGGPPSLPPSATL